MAGKMNSQDVALAEIKNDISEIKSSLKDLAEATKTLAVHATRLGTVEERVKRLEDSHDEMWDKVAAMSTTCALREPVYKFGLRKMEDGKPQSHNEWLNMFLGSALRNGIWIVITGVLMILVNKYVR